ncbi:Thaumatin-like protein 1 [Ranunculus cassubicifolius]
MELVIMLILLLALSIPGTYSATFTFKNNCPYTIWPATLTGGGRAQFPTTGFELGSGAAESRGAPDSWSGRFWARTGCTTNNGRFTCSTADCGSGQIGCNGAGGTPPASLAEFTLNGNGNQDFYDISLVDGFNLPLSVTPQGGGGSSCRQVSCQANVNAACPSELAVRGPGGSTIACKSACFAFNQPQYCCTGQFNSPNACQPTNYSKIFKNACPQAYSYAYDDSTSTFTCSVGANYLITFCP